MTEVTSICQNRMFTFDEASDMVRFFKRITKKHESRIETIMERQRWLVKTGAGHHLIKECDDQVGREMVWWGQKFAKLGCIVFANSYIGMNSGYFYWSWHPGEDKILFYHEYSQTPDQRKSLDTFRGLGNEKV